MRVEGPWLRFTDRLAVAGAHEAMLRLHVAPGLQVAASSEGLRILDSGLPLALLETTGFEWYVDEIALSPRVREGGDAAVAVRPHGVRRPAHAGVGHPSPLKETRCRLADLSAHGPCQGPAVMDGRGKLDLPNEHRGRATMSSLLPRLADALARFSARWVPDSLSIAALLTFLTLALGLTVGGASPAQCVLAWGGGVWALLSFGMQIALVVFAGYVLAVAPPVARALDAVARFPRGPRSAVAWTAFLSMALCWLNWGVGLIASAMLVRTIGRARPDTDYRLLVAVAYLGMGTTWHGGPSGSVPLLFATPGSFMIRDGLLSAPVPLSETIFTGANLGLMLVVVVALTAFAALLHPPPAATFAVRTETLAALARFEPPARPASPSPAEWLAHGPWLNRGLGLLALASLLLQMRAGTFAATLDSVNLVALALGLLLHPSPASLAKAAEEASRPLHGVVLQFPLYAGIYGVIKGTGLVESLTHALLVVSTARSYPLVVFAYSAVLNYLVPSGGAKWAMEAPYVLGAARELGVPATSAAMAYAYGDMATNLVQPFWAIPLLAVARLEFRDILGYELLALGVYAVLVSVALLLV